MLHTIIFYTVCMYVCMSVPSCAIIINFGRSALRIVYSSLTCYYQVKKWLIQFMTVNTICQLMQQVGLTSHSYTHTHTHISGCVHVVMHQNTRLRHDLSQVIHY